MTYQTVLKNLFNSDGQAKAQTQPLPGQIANSVGGYFYPIDDWARLERFLILGSEGGTYYASELRLTAENVAVVERVLAADGKRAVATIVEIGTSRRAPKHQPVLFALALAASAEDPVTRRAALEALPQVARTGTHLLTFTEYANTLRGWGRGLRRGVAGWFTGQATERLAFQAIKYRQREGRALRDVVRLAHPLTDDLDRKALFDWIAHPDDPEAVKVARGLYRLVDARQAIQETDDAAEAARLIETQSLPREAVPTAFLSDARVWDALLVDMPVTAMIRNLGKITQVGLLSQGSDAAKYVADRLGDRDQLAAARVHPIQLLLALKTYAQGRGVRGRLEWEPVAAIVDALDSAIYDAFEQVPATGKRILVGVDVSGSMSWDRCTGASVLEPVEAAAAITLQLLQTEENVRVIAFDTAVHQPGLSRRQRFDDVARKLASYGGGTDISLPLNYAIEQRQEVDAFVVLTDNETWAGREHPAQALARYRETINPNAKIAVLAFTANHGSIVPEDDPRAFGVVGFDAAVPELLREFLAD